MEPQEGYGSSCQEEMYTLSRSVAVGNIAYNDIIVNFFTVENDFWMTCDLDKAIKVHKKANERLHLTYTSCHPF